VLFNFMRRPLIARNNNLDIRYSVFTSGGVTYSSPDYVIPQAKVAEIFDRFQLVIFPLVNPDGRQFSGGRSPAPASV
jgi:hypothetical protein